MLKLHYIIIYIGIYIVESTWLMTHGSKDYSGPWYSVEDRRSVVFSVKACASVYVILSDQMVSFKKFDRGTNVFTLII